MRWGADDFAKARMRLSERPETRIAGERARLNALAALVETVECRRALLLRHFGEHPPERCGNCDHCRSARAARSEEHTSELQSLMRISYAVSCLQKKYKTSSNIRTELHARVVPTTSCSAA